MNSSEIARRALQRADDIREQRKRGQRRLKVAAICCGFATIIMIPVSMQGGRFSLPDLSGTEVTIYDSGTPLAEQPVLSLESIFSAVQGDVVMTYGNGVIDEDSSAPELILVNPEGSLETLVFKIVLKETGETLYQSLPLEAGVRIENPELSRRPDKGSHPVEIIILAQAPGDSSVATRATIEMELEAK